MTEKDKPLRAVLIKRNPKNNRLILEDTTFIDTLDNLYKLLECDLIEIQVRYINGKAYDLIFDEEYLINGKSQEPNNAVAIGSYDNKNIQEIIFGNLIICGIADQDGKETSLNDYDINKILRSITVITNTENGTKLDVLNYNFTETPKADA